MQQNTINCTHNEGDFRFLYICHVVKCEINPHDRFFLHGHRPCVRDKYEVCFAFILGKPSTNKQTLVPGLELKTLSGAHIPEHCFFLIFLSRSGMEHFVRSSYPGSSRKTLRNLKKRQRAGTISELTGDKNIPTYVLPLRGIIHFKIQHSWQKVRTLKFWFPEETPLFFQ